MNIDNQTINLLKAIVGQLEDLGNVDSIQYFDFEIRGYRISGQLEIKLDKQMELK